MKLNEELLCRRLMAVMLVMLLKRLDLDRGAM